MNNYVYMKKMVIFALIITLKKSNISFLHIGLRKINF